jgi:hypothetical protein
VRVGQLRVERGATNRPQPQEDGQSEERDADHNTHQTVVGEDQNCGADRCCQQPERSHRSLLSSAYAVSVSLRVFGRLTTGGRITLGFGELANGASEYLPPVSHVESDGGRPTVAVCASVSSWIAFVRSRIWLESPISSTFCCSSDCTIRHSWSARYLRASSWRF